MSRTKIFLLFGATGNLGKASAAYFLKQNYDYYYIFARTEIEFPVKKKCYSIITVGDLTIEENVISAFAKVDQKKDADYYLFSTVGAFIGGKPISKTDYSDLKKMMNINLYSSFLIAKHFAKLVEQTGSGSICFTSALSSFKPEANKAVYNISKNALNLLVESLAIEGEEIHLRANAIAPFAIDTESNREWLDDFSKLVSPEEICKVVQSLLADNLATGQIIKLP